MENSAYVPNPLPPPALVVFSQAGSLPEALRMQRPFNTQAQEAKDLQVPFSAAGFGLRLMDSYPGLPAHLLHHLQPQFHLHPSLDPRSVSFGPGAFQPITSENSKVFPSAFAPPSNKCLKMEGSDNSVNCYQNDKAESSSPASASLSPSIPATLTTPGITKDETDHIITEGRDTETPGSETAERSSPEEPGRGYRRKKKADPSCCPVCGVTVRGGELEAHFVQELERLYKLTTNPRARKLASPAARDRDGVSSADGSLEGRWETYQRIRTNRQGRLRIKNRKRKPDDVSCPVCNDPIHGTLEELNNHVEICLRKHGSGPDEDENVDVEGEGDAEMYEEYEWAGQKRIRASTLLVGGYAGVGMTTISKTTDDEEGDLVVDGDDSSTFGPTQYKEADVVIPSADGPAEEREREALREAVISPDGTRHAGFDSGDSSINRLNVKEEPLSLESRHEYENNLIVGSHSHSQVVEALKSRIRDLEYEAKALPEEKFVCLICMEHYKKPVISICCWHVHCEECWLHTLGAKKLCPQCNMITSPSDLRRIYL